MEPSISICALCGGEVLNDDWAVDILVRALITRIQSIPREWTSGMNQNQPDLIQRLDAYIARAKELEELRSREGEKCQT